MSLIILFLLGIVAGMAVALPYGPVGFVIIRRFYLFGIKSGMVSAVGNAASDLFYAIVVGFGLHRIQHFLLSISTYTEIGAGLVLIYLGYRAVTTKLSLDENEIENHPMQDVTSTFLINILNPALIFAFALVFTILGKIMHGIPFHFWQTFIFLVGVPIGIVQRINYITGAILGILGIVLLLGTLIKLIK